MIGPKLISFDKARAAVARQHSLCHIKRLSSLVSTITFVRTSTDVYARTPDRWAAIDILRGCRDVTLGRNVSAKAPYGVQLNQEVAEEEVAAVLAAAGIAPYRGKGRSRVLTALLGGNRRGTENYMWDDALRALETCGLVTTTIDGKAAYGRIRPRAFEWTPAAWRTLLPVDERALAGLAA